MRPTASATFTLRSPVTRGLERIPIGSNRDALKIPWVCACPCRKTGSHFSGTCADSARSFSRLDGRRRQVLGLLQARPLLGGTPLTDGLELAQENPPQEGDAGGGGRQVLLRAIADDPLSAHRDVVLRVEQAEFVHALDHAIVEQLVVVVGGVVVQIVFLLELLDLAGI